MLPSFARRRPARWVALLAGFAALVAAAPAAAQSPDPTLNVVAAQDAVLATGLPFGSHTVQVTRPDAMTGAPVVIGHYRGLQLRQPAVLRQHDRPDPGDPDGDCWQAGGLSLPGGVGLTPDIRPGDTVSVTGGPTVKVGDSPGNGPGGPINGCDAVSTWARNMAATSAQPAPGGDLAVSGQAQPLTTGVAVTATDGARTTQPADATLAADGNWTATIPAAQLSALTPGRVTVQPVFAVPDVVTGAAAHIAGVAVNGDFAAAAPGQSGSNAGNQDEPNGAGPAARPEIIRLGGVRTSMRVSLAAARAGRMSASFVVPTGARYVRVRLARSGQTAFSRVLAAGRPGTRQTVRLRGSASALGKLVRGRYTLSVGAGPSKTQLGTQVVRRSLRIG